MRAQSCLTLCDPTDCNPPGSSIHGVLQSGILEWVALFYSRGSSNPGIETESLASPASQVDSLPRSNLRTPFLYLALSIKQIKLTNCDRKPSLTEINKSRILHYTSIAVN